MQARRLIFAGISVLGFLLLSMPAMAAESTPSGSLTPAPAQKQPRPEAVFAVVDGSVIDVARYEAEMNLLIREKFYHRRPPEGQMGPVRREVGDRLIERVLLLAESKRRGIAPDAAKVAQVIAAFEARNKNHPLWTQQREALLPELKAEVEQQSMLDRLEAAARAAPQAGEEELRRYHAEHKDKFTEPDRLRLSLILLRVGAGSPQAEWDQAKALAQGLREQLLAGADFAALARQHSKDDSAPKGGDMGYVHRGMLSEELHVEIDKLKQGELSGPLQMLEGIGLFRVDERIAPLPKSFDESKVRALQLWQKEQSERQWLELKAALRKVAVIEIRDSSRYPALEVVKP